MIKYSGEFSYSGELKTYHSNASMQIQHAFQFSIFFCLRLAITNTKDIEKFSHFIDSVLKLNVLSVDNVKVYVEYGDLIHYGKVSENV